MKGSLDRGRGGRRPGSSVSRAGSPAVVVGSVLVVVMAVFVFGPRPTFDERWVEPDLPADLDAYLAGAESRVPDLRPGDGREVVWHDPGTRDRTRVGLVYLHGFSADRHELEPVVTEVARELEANAYFARLTGHGRDGRAMAEATVEDWLDDTAEAVAVGGRIGERVVVIGTSTGGTLALWAAARPEGRERIDAVVLVSPNLQPRDRSSRILLYPWGGVLARLIVGPERCFTPENEAQERHWTTCYPTSALSPMMALVEHVRTMDPSGVRAPALVVYSPEDVVVDATETERVVERLRRTREHRGAVDGQTDEGAARQRSSGRVSGGAAGASVEVHRVEETGDPSRHVLAGDVLSPGTNDEVRDVMVGFIRRVVGPEYAEPGG